MDSLEDTLVGKPQGTNPGCDIGWAVDMMKSGYRVTRGGWNGRDMWLALQVPDGNSKMTLPYVYMKTVSGQTVPWLCSQTDLLAIDWRMVEE
jgi:hypothetical protein